VKTYRFKQVDAFTSRPFFGNPVAVVLEGDGLSDGEMQRIAAWTNLSETTFVQRPTTPEADYRLRIFYPRGELRFAGHPTIGSAHAVLEAGLVSPRDGRMVMECGAGNLPLRIQGVGGERRIHVEAPEARFVAEHPEAVEALATALGVPVMATPVPTAFDNGPTWLFTCVEKEEYLRTMKPDLSAIARLERELRIAGPAVFALLDGQGKGHEPEFAVHIRCFAPGGGVPEDPVTGSANAALPAHLARAGMLERLGREYVSTQGTEIGRDGRVYVRVLDDSGRAEIGGQAVTVIEGELRV